MYESNWGLGLGNAIGWSALAEQTFSRDLSMGQIHVRTCVHLHMLDERSGQLLAKWIVYRDDYLKQLFLSSSLLQLQRIKSQKFNIVAALGSVVFAAAFLIWAICSFQENPEMSKNLKWVIPETSNSWNEQNPEMSKNWVTTACCVS